MLEHLYGDMFDRVWHFVKSQSFITLCLYSVDVSSLIIRECIGLYSDNFSTTTSPTTSPNTRG